MKHETLFPCILTVFQETKCSENHITSHWMFKALNQNSCYGRQPHFHGTDSYKFKFGSIERPKDDLKDANDRQPTTGLMV